MVFRLALLSVLFLGVSPLSASEAEVQGGLRSEGLLAFSGDDADGFDMNGKKYVRDITGGQKHGLITGVESGTGKVGEGLTFAGSGLVDLRTSLLERPYSIFLSKGKVYAEGGYPALWKYRMVRMYRKVSTCSCCS